MTMIFTSLALSISPKDKAITTAADAWPATCCLRQQV